jgi:hypothetical protein
VPAHAATPKDGDFVPRFDEGKAGHEGLAKTFKRNGFTHNQVVRESNIAIYRRAKRIRSKEIERFEVVIIRVLPEHIAFGRLFPEREIYPRSEEWGTYGWTYRDMEAAWKKGMGF